MKLSHFKVLSGFALTLAAILVSSPARAGTIDLINNDTFNNVTTFETTYQVQQALSGTVDSYFTTIDNSLNSSCSTGLGCLSNVDVLGNITAAPNLSLTYNLTPFQGICAASGNVDCIDLDGSGGPNGTAQGALQATVNVTTAGNVVLSSGIMGASGFLCSNPVTNPNEIAGSNPCSDGSVDGTGRNINASVLIVFGNSSCFTGESTVGGYQSNANCLYVDSVTPATVNSVDNQTSSSMFVGAGTYYVEYLSETAGNMGDLLTSANLIETVPDVVTSPEPATLVLLGSALLGLGLARRRKRPASVRP